MGYNFAICIVRIRYCIIWSFPLWIHYLYKIFKKKTVIELGMAYL